MKSLIEDSAKGLASTNEDVKMQRQELNELVDRVQKLADKARHPIPELQQLDLTEISNLNLSLDDLMSEKYKDKRYPAFPKLSASDILISSVAGLLAVVIDFILVGTPEVVKIYRGGERFDGSILTSAIRKMKDGPVSGFAEQLSSICKVPYDVAVIKDAMYPQNHRLRSLAHDPFFGLFFAVFDIVCGTVTFIDNSGSLRILKSPINNKALPEKYMAVFFYIGHIISDLFTTRGIPVPGFFLTQFFTSGDVDNSIAKAAQNMYLDGYDMRHLASMAVPVMVKDLILTAYFHLSKMDIPELVEPVANKEKRQIEEVLRKEKMAFIANSIAVGGNAVKFFAPPFSCNPNSLNAAEWYAFLQSSISMVSAASRDTSTEQAIHNREKIDHRWDELLDTK